MQRSEQCRHRSEDGAQCTEASTLKEYRFEVFSVLIER
jgi:hypothetical protein